MEEEESSAEWKLLGNVTLQGQSNYYLMPKFMSIPRQEFLYYVKPGEVSISFMKVRWKNPAPIKGYGFQFKVIAEVGGEGEGCL